MTPISETIIPLPIILIVFNNNKPLSFTDIQQTLVCKLQVNTGSDNTKHF